MNLTRLRTAALNALAWRDPEDPDDVPTGLGDVAGGLLFAAWIVVMLALLKMMAS